MVKTVHKIFMTCPELVIIDLQSQFMRVQYKQTVELVCSESEATTQYTKKINQPNIYEYLIMELKKCFKFPISVK